MTEPVLAKRAVVRDARGDAKAPWDITKMVVTNGQRKLRIRVVYRGALQPDPYQGLLTNVKLDLGDPSNSIYSPDFTLDMLRGSANPKVPDRLHLNRMIGYDAQRVRCGKLRVRVRYRRGILDFSVPQRCFRGEAGRVRVAGFTYTPCGNPDEADYIDKWSRWIARG